MSEASQEILLFSSDVTVMDIVRQLEGYNIQIHAPEHLRQFAGDAHLLIIDINEWGQDITLLRNLLVSQPVLVIGEVADIARLNTCIELGARAYLVKPVSAAILGRYLVSMIDMHRLRQMYNRIMSFLSHELKNHLTAVRGYAHLLLTAPHEGNPPVEALSEGQSKFASVIHVNSERSFHVIDNIRDLTRIETGTFELDPEPTAPLSLLQFAAMRYAEDIGARQQKLEFDLPDDLPFVMADELRLGQAFAAVIDNAHKYTPDGGCIQIAASADEEQIHITIQDSGIGIAADELSRLLQEPFFRATAARNMPGYGIALYIARHIIEGHGGRLWLDSTPNSGTSAHIVIPILKLPD